MMHRDISNRTRRKQRTIFSAALLLGLGLCGQIVFRETFDEQTDVRWTGPVQYVERQPENRAARLTSGEALRSRDTFAELTAARMTFELNHDLRWHNDGRLRIGMPGGLALGFKGWNNGFVLWFGGKVIAEEPWKTHSTHRVWRRYTLEQVGTVARLLVDDALIGVWSTGRPPNMATHPAITATLGPDHPEADAKLDSITLTALNAAHWDPTLDNSPTLHTVAMDVSLTLTEPQDTPIPIRVTLMDDSVWETLLSPGAGKQLDRTLAPDGFEPILRGGTGMALHFYAAKRVVAVTTSPARLAVTWDQRRTRDFPWETDPDPAGSDGNLTWWPGVHRNNAGHFGWRYEPNGLLINNVSFDRIERSWYYFKPGRTRESFQFNFSIPGAQMPARERVEVADDARERTGIARHIDYRVDQGIYRDDQIDADWTSVRWTRQVKTVDGDSYSQQVRYSILAPGIQIETDAPEFVLSFQDEEHRWAPGILVMPAEKGVRVAGADLGADPELMAKHWICLLADDGTPEIPVIVCFTRRPEALQWTNSGLLIRRPGGVGTLAIGTPFGVLPQQRDLAQRWRTQPDAIPVDRLDRFARLLAGYPWRCTESFAVDGTAVRIRNEVEHLPWEDDWATTPLRVAPLPPLVTYAMDKGILPPQTLSGETENLDLPTKWGPYRAMRGSVAEYALPLPRAWDLFPLRVSAPANRQWLEEILHNSLTVEAIERKFTGKPAPTIYPHGAAHDFSAGAWRSANAMSTPMRSLLRERTRTYVHSALFPQNYRYRQDPVAGAEYLACTFAWRQTDEVNDDGCADVDYWQGLTLYGLYTHAKYAADWDLVQRHWPLIRSLVSYWESTHSWALMGPGAREGGEMFHGDMPTAGYAGLVGYHKLASRLGTPYQRDLGAYLLAKAALPMSAKFGFKPWCVALQHQEATGSTGECTGFGERWIASFPSVSADIRGTNTGSPWWQTGCIGPQSAQFESLDLLMNRVPDDMLQFERVFAANCPNDALRSQRPENVMPHVMLRVWLGGAMRESGEALLKSYRQTHMLRDTHLLAAILAWDCPVRLEDWTPAYITEARWDKDTRTASIGLDAGNTPARLRVTVRDGRPTARVDAAAVPVQRHDTWGQWTRYSVNVPAGRHSVHLTVP